MAQCYGDAAAGLRPHFKAHQVLSLAAKQIAAGAIGITCSRVGHAEALVESGCRSVLIANEIAGEIEIRRFVELSHRAPVIVAVDNAGVVEMMARVAGANRPALNVLVDVDVGLHRCGVSPGEPALQLVRLVLHKGLTFRGLMGYAGMIKLPPGPEHERAAQSALKPLLDTKSCIESAGIPVEITSCGGTSDHATAAQTGGVTEIQAGSYLLMDTNYVPFAPEFKPALSVMTTVISSIPGQRLVVDAGLKALSSQGGLPIVRCTPLLRVTALHAEHALVDIVDTYKVSVGDRLELCVPYLDSTIQLHERMYGIRNGRVEENFKIEH